MSKMIRALAVYLSAFVAGVLCSLFTSEYVVSNVWENAEEILFSKDLPSRLSNEYIVRNSISVVNALDAGQQEQVYELSCMSLLTITQHIDPVIYKHVPTRAQEVKDLKISAIETLEKLQREGYCGQ